MTLSYTVIIPCFNAKHYILTAVNSALNQTLPPSAVIVIDDGSTDGSGELLDATYGQHNRVQILRHPRGERCGVLVSRTLGVTAAETEWVAFLDADDVFLPDKMAYQALALQEHPQALMIHSSVEVIYAPDISPSSWNNDFRIGPDEIREYMLPEEAYWMDKNQICNSTTFVRKEPLLAIMQQLASVQVFQYEDWLVWSLLGFKGSFVYEPRPTTQYRLHAKSATAAILKNRMTHSYAYIELLLQLMIHIPETMRERFFPPLGRRFRYSIKKMTKTYASSASVSPHLVDHIAATLLTRSSAPSPSSTGDKS